MVTKLNEGYITESLGLPSYHAVIAAADLVNGAERFGTIAKGWNSDTNSGVELVWGKAGEALAVGHLCVFEDGYSASSVDASNTGPVGVAVGNGIQGDAIASGSGCWFIRQGIARVHSGQVAAGNQLYIDAANPGGVDDAAVTGDRIHGAFSVEATVTTASAYNENTTKCILSNPVVSDAED